MSITKDNLRVQALHQQHGEKQINQAQRHEIEQAFTRRRIMRELRVQARA